ncbi:TPA: hypothetical protein ACNIG2_001492 [Proteus mirabilis]
MQLHQQKGMISLSPPTICNSAQPNDKRKNRFSPAQIELWKKEQEDQEPRDAWLTESEEAIKRHMKDL